LPKFGEWDVNDPSSAEGFTVIFNKARNEKKGGGKSDSPGKDEPGYNKNGEVLEKPAKKMVLLYTRRISGEVFALEGLLSISKIILHQEDWSLSDKP